MVTIKAETHSEGKHAYPAPLVAANRRHFWPDNSHRWPVDRSGRAKRAGSKCGAAERQKFSERGHHSGRAEWVSVRTECERREQQQWERQWWAGCCRQRRLRYADRFDSVDRGHGDME